MKDKEEKQDVATKPVEVKEVENPVTATSEEVATDKGEETPAAAADESKEVTPAPAAKESTETAAPSPEDNSGETAPAAAEESSETTEEENSGDQEASEETPEVKVRSNYNLLLIASCLCYVSYFLVRSFDFTYYNFLVCIQLETAPADFRFPTTNQTRHCFTRYIEYHR